MKTRILAIYLPEPISRESLPELASTLLTFSPRVGIRPPDLLYLDLTTTARLFGGELPLLARLGDFFTQRKIRAQTVIADDLATAGALARVFPWKIVPPRGSEKALDALPCEHLRFLANPLSPPTPFESQSAEQVIRLLSLLGIGTLGGFAHLPSSTIGTRFGPLGAELQRRCRGESALPLRPFEAVQSYRQQQSFEDAVSNIEPLLFSAKALLEKLERQLEHGLQAASQLNLYFEMEGCEEISFSLPLLRPLRHAKALFDVVREKLSPVTFPAPVISMAVEIALPVRTPASQFHLFDTHEEQSEKLDALFGRLLAGLGPTMISAAALRERHRPEASFETVPFEPLAKKRPDATPALPRPTLLVSPPEKLEYQKSASGWSFSGERKRFQVSALYGPERLQGEWWSPDAYARDYFVAETKNGERLWIYRTPDERFYLHGYFD